MKLPTIAAEVPQTLGDYSRMAKQMAANIHTAETYTGKTDTSNLLAKLLNKIEADLRRLLNLHQVGCKPSLAIPERVKPDIFVAIGLHGDLAALCEAGS